MSLTPQTRERCVIGALAFFIVFEFAVFAAPHIARAQPHPTPDVVLELKTEATAEKIKLTKTGLTLAAVYSGLLSAVSFFLQKLAYDSAVWIASGGSGQGSLVFQQGWGSYLASTARDAAGDFIGSLSDGLNIPGLNLCSPSLSVILKIQIGLALQVEKPTPRCTWNQISQNWGSFAESFETGEVLNQIGVSFEPGQSPLSAALEVNRQLLVQIGKKEKEAEETRREGSGFRPVTSLISGGIQTPSEVVVEEFKERLKGGKEQREYAVSGAFFNAEVGFAILRTAVNTFVNTLAQKLFERVAGGFFSVGDLFRDEESVFNPEFASVGGREAARQIFAELQTANIQTVESYDLVGEFTICPPTRGPMNCVMDDQFAAAIGQANAGRPMTVGEAIDQGLLHGDWPLIPTSDVARNQDQYCYTYAYCSSNLVKLRRARILPVGWELAAGSPANSAGDPVSLREVMNAFNDCNEAGNLDDAHPYCHLIDPNWVLKYPPTQCRALVNGPTLVDINSDQRAEVCVDTPSCVSEDGQGNCIGGWGYCTREKNIWRFDGDACPAYFNTCQAFQGTGPDRRELAVRTNTVDFGVCNADNAGCRWYSTAQDFIDSDTPEDRVCAGGTNQGARCSADAACPGSVCIPDETPFVSEPQPDTLVWNETSRIYLNRRAGACEAQNAGCTELVPKATGVTLNLVRNSSFEQNDDALASIPDFWDGTLAVDGVSTDGSQASHGSDAVKFSAAADFLTQRITIAPNRFYTMSFHAKREGTGAARLSIQLYNASNALIPDSVLDDYFDNCPTSVPGGHALDFTASANYERRSCTFTAPAPAAYAFLTAERTAGAVWIDAAQLEENEVATAYGDGYSGPGAGERVYLKAPPEGLCTGGPNDPPVCENYAAVCSATEVGCELYTPANGDPPIPGIARPSDQCPAACVGYQTFREEPTNFNQDGEYPVYFIPDTARTCSAANAGCDEFTNLRAGPDAEAREYYSYLRLCEEPSTPPDTGIFYTWEGSDATGFQLRTWQLKQSNLTSGVGAVDPSGGVAPCTNYNAAAGTCVDPSPSTPPESCNGRADIFTNPDCREFYDVEGKIHYRPYSRTIVKTDQCIDFRKTGSSSTDCTASGGRFDGSQCFYRAYVPESNSCPASQNACRLYTGNAGRNVQTFFEDDFEDGDLDGWDTASATISNESLATSGHSMRKAEGFGAIYSGPQDPASLRGRTILISFWAKGTPNQALEVRYGSAPAARLFSYADTDPATPTVTLGTDWRFYELGPLQVDWQVAPGTGFGCSGSGTCTVDIDGGGPMPARVWCTIPSGGTSCVFDYVKIGTATPGAELFLDNLIFKFVTENIAVIRDSWQTPAVCNATPEGAYSAQEMLGCQAYRDRAGNTVYLKGFSELCREAAVGCGAFFDSQNSSSLYAESWNYFCVRPDGLAGSCSVDPDGGGPLALREVCTIPPGENRCNFKWDGELIDADPDPLDTFSPSLPFRYVNGTETATTRPFFYDESLAVVPADSTVYLVDSEEKRCEPDARGCQAFGLPTFNAERTEVTGFDDVLRQIQPDTFGETLCSEESLFCEAWRTREGSEFYFKDPLDKVCEYKESGPGGTFGWFRKGTDEPCYGNFVERGEEYGIWTNQAVCALGSACTSSGGCPCPATAEPASVQCTARLGETTCSPFDGRAGTCEERFAGCTEFLDPADTAVALYPQGKPYDFLKNDRLDEGNQPPTERCDGEVSQREGCVLFNDTSEGVRRWNTGATYLKSEKANFARVSPVDCMNPAAGDERYCNVCTIFLIGVGGTSRYCEAGSGSGLLSPVRVSTNDSNLILRVRRDRECSEWLACDSPQTVFDPRRGQWVTACSSLDLCNAPAKVKDLSSCQYVTDKPEPRVLTRAVYADRDVSWYGAEYAGYSIPGLFPVHELEAVNVGACVPADMNLNSLVIPENIEVEVCNEDNEFPADNCDDAPGDEECVSHFRLARVIGPCDAPQGASCTIGQCSGTNDPCSLDPAGSPVGCPAGQTCDLAFPIGFGRCYSGECAQAPGGTSSTGTSLDADGPNANSAPASCRAYPEPNSPFPSTSLVGVIEEVWTENDPTTLLDDVPLTVTHGFQNTQLCARGESCECTYKKVTYEGGGLRYFSEDEFGVEGICDGGPTPGRKCENDDECTLSDAAGNPISSGRCALRTRADRFIGLPGFCLEQDLSVTLNADPNARACLTWYPVDQIAGAPSLYNQFQAAGWQPPELQEWYCAEGTEGDLQLHLDYDMSGAITSQYFDEPESDTDVTSHLHGEEEDCQERGGGMICLWPQRQCGGPWTHADNAEPPDDAFCDEADNESGPNNPFSESGGNPPSFGHNFFGCYEVADEGSLADSLVRYPWIGPPVYQWQVKEFRITLKWSGSGSTPNPYRCGGYTGDGGDDGFGSVTRSFGPNAQITDPALFSSDQGAMSVIPLWVGNQLRSFEVHARDDNDEITFFIYGLDIVFWPSCLEIAETGGGDNQAAFTDRVVSGNYTFITPRDAVTANTACSPWGGIGEFDPSVPARPADQRLLVVDTDPSECSVAQTDIFYAGRPPSSQALANLFARSGPLRSFEGILESGSPGFGSLFGGGATGVCNAGGWQGTACVNAEACRYEGTCSRTCNKGLNVGRICGTESDPTAFCRDFDKRCLNAFCYACPPGVSDPEECEKTMPELSCGADSGCAGIDEADTAASVCRESPSCVGTNAPNISCSSDSECIEGDATCGPAWFVATGEINDADFWSYDPAPNSLRWDVTETADGGAARAPEVRPLGPCTGPGVCEELLGEDGMTVNNQNFGAVGGARQVRATMRFFMHADRNRMPIERLVIDWGDGDDRYDQEGSYRNHRGAGQCTDAAEEPADGNTDPEFGRTADSCVESPVEVTHDYKCSEAILAELLNCAGGGRPDPLAPGGYAGCNDGGTCVYVPRVFAMDAWGWCASDGGNGCPGAPGGAGCYDGEIDTGVSTTDVDRNECKVTLPSADNPLTTDINESVKDPWVYFDGKIVVEP